VRVFLLNSFFSSGVKISWGLLVVELYGAFFLKQFGSRMFSSWSCWCFVCTLPSMITLYTLQFRVPPSTCLKAEGITMRRPQYFASTYG
jgi:hypothetical protein